MGKQGLGFIAAGLVLVLVGGALLWSSMGSVASEWAYDLVGLRAAQKRGFDGTGVVVAVIDTGFDPHHPSLKDAEVHRWKDYVNGRAEPYDDLGHGSHVTGIIVGKGTTFAGRFQGFTMKGAAPGVSLIVVKAISAQGTGNPGDVADGIRFSVQNGADIICLSLGSREQPLPVTDDITSAVNDAINRGVLVVAAAGNTGQDSSRNDVESPATINRVIAVGAVDEDRRVADFSARGNADDNYGTETPAGHIPGPTTRKDPNKKPEIVAPGVDIKSAWKDNQYAVAKGTSQAAPFVCGALALLLEAKPQLKADNTAGMVDRVKDALRKSAQPLPGYAVPHDPAAGYGLLRADRLLNQ